MDNLGAAYAELQTGDRTENLMRAVTAFMAALRARTPEMAPEDCGKTLDSLGVAQSFRKDWAGVVDTTQRWLALAERRRGSALDRAARQRVGDELWRPLVRGVIAANRLQRFDLALQFSTYGKARTLANHMARRDARPRHMDPQEWTSYQDLLHKQGMLEREYRRELAAPHDERSNAGQLEALEQLQSLSARLKKMEGRFSELDPDYAPFAMPVRIEDWCEIAAMSRSVLVDFQVTPKGSYLSMVGPEERTPGCQCMVLPKLTSTRLRKFVAEWVSEYYLRRTPWAEFLDSFCRGLYERILSPLHRRLRKRYPQATRLVLLPNLGLKLLPLHAAWYQVADGSRRYFGDDYQISYAPSIGVLDRCLKRRQTQSASCGRLVALQSPRLAFAAWEVNAAGRYFDTTKTRRIGPRNIHKRDVMEAIQQASHLLFTTHAIFAPGDADDSALELNGPDEEYLTAREIVNLDLRRTQLAVLSACETGVSDIRDCSDEYLGLASAFLIAGVQTVIASQWPVDDLATALLMHRLFENLYDRGMGNAEALRAAQQWLRALTRKELGELHRHFAGIPGGADRRGFAGSDPTDWFAGDDPTEQLFANPFYWAPFYSFGAP
jgi:CHAT domain-containing protein